MSFDLNHGFWPMLSVTLMLTRAFGCRWVSQLVTLKPCRGQSLPASPRLRAPRSHPSPACVRTPQAPTDRQQTTRAPRQVHLWCQGSAHGNLESRRKFLERSPGAAAALHAGRCSLAGAHLHIKREGWLHFIQIGLSLLAPGSLPAPSRSSREPPKFSRCAEAGARLLGAGRARCHAGRPLSKPRVSVSQRRGLPPCGRDRGTLPLSGGSSGGCHGKSPLSASA